jgi:hypothetical protein
MPTKVSTIEIDMTELDGILRRVDANELTEGDCEAIRTLCKAYVQLTELSKEDADGTSKDKPNRRGLFTSGIVSTREGRKIALFFSGRQHAGENLKDLLSHRAKALDALIQMCDALSRNLPADLETIVAHCLAILHRKNALFYKTGHGAHVGDVFMSLIHTCELCGANAFDYLTELERHAKDLSSNPQDWMPWNYRETSPSKGT